MERVNFQIVFSLTQRLDLDPSWGVQHTVLCSVNFVETKQVQCFRKEEEPARTKQERHTWGSNCMPQAMLGTSEYSRVLSSAVEAMLSSF